MQPIDTPFIVTPGMRLLVVDGNLEVRMRLSEIFQSAPFIEFIQAASLSEGFDQLRQAMPDVMVVDIEFPGGNGLNLLSHAKQNFPSVIVLVNTNAISYRKHCLALGADFFFDKSLEINHLVDAIISIHRSERQH